MKNPIISVIIPNYCHARYLHDRIESILAQTYRNFEIIILDDNSSDESRDVIETYRNNAHISHIIYNEQNSGNTFEQWEKGIKLAKGDLCYIAESDDSCYPLLLEKLVSFFEKDDHLVLACCRTFFMNNDGIIYDGMYPKFRPEIIDGKQFIGEFMSGMNYIRNAGMAIFRRDIALSISKEYKNHPGAGDYFFWICISELGRVGITYEPLNLFRRHEDTITGKRDRDGSNLRSEYQIVEYIHQKGFISDSRRETISHEKCEYIKTQIYDDEIIKNNLIELWGGSHQRKKEHWPSPNPKKLGYSATQQDHIFPVQSRN